MREPPIHFRDELWSDLLRQLHARGGGEHEAGAFLLGPLESPTRAVTQVLYYDELDRNAYSSGVCVLYADSFEQLARFCRERSLCVVADIHTHPGSPGQSASDRANPMVAQAGHIAIIVPNDAAPPMWRHRLGLYRYRGAHQWDNLSGWSARRVLRTGTGR